jgi:hypothetical protein
LQARARVKQLVDNNRHQNANVRFDVLAQSNRQNHMTLVEGRKRLADKGCGERVGGDDFVPS